MKMLLQYLGLFFFLMVRTDAQAQAQEDAMKGHDMADMPKAAPAPPPSANPHEGMDMGKESEAKTRPQMKEMEGMSMPSSNTDSNPHAKMPGMMDMPIPKARGPVAYGLPPHVVKGWHPPVMDQTINYYVVADKLEYGLGQGSDLFVWDLQGWVGDDYNKFWWKTEGEQQISGDIAGEVEVQALYSRLITPFWFAQIGIRRDQSWESDKNQGRTFAVLGFEGLTPYMFDLEPTLFISEEGDVSVRLTATYDFLLTQRLILQPRLDFDAAVQSAEEYGVGAGPNSIGLGLRLRYEFRREFAPYIGVQWLQQFGETADISRREGKRAEDLMVVFGTRFWF